MRSRASFTTRPEPNEGIGIGSNATCDSIEIPGAPESKTGAIHGPSVARRYGPFWGT